MLNLEELKDIIVYLVYRCGLPHLPEYAIQKLIFLAEIESYKTTERRLTEANYRSYNYGPYSKDVSDAIEQLRDDHRVNFRHHSALSKRSYEGIEATTERPRVSNIAPEKHPILEKICTEWGRKRGDQMVEYIYRTYIYASTPFDRPYEFEKILPNLIDEKIDEDEVADSEMLKNEQENEFRSLENIHPPKQYQCPQ